MGKAIFFKSIKDSKHQMRISFLHADDALHQFKHEPTSTLRDMWWLVFSTHLSLIERLDAGEPYKDIAEELIRAWHFLLAITGVLKSNFEWNYDKGQPSDAPKFC